MRFAGAGGGGMGSSSAWLIDNNFTRNVATAISRFVGTDVNFQQEAGDPTLSSLVMAAVNWLGRALPEAPLVVMEMGSDGKETPNYQHPALAVLKRPNPFYSGATLWKAFATSWLIGGNAYWLKARNARGQVVQLWNAPHWMVTARWPSYQSTTFIDYYEYELDGARYPIQPADLVHFRNGLADDGRNGRSPLDPVWREIYKDVQESNYGALLAKNGAVPPVVLSLTDAALASETEVQAYKEKYQQATQDDNRGKVFVSSQKVDVHKLGFSPEELDLSAAHFFNEQRFCAIIGIDANVLGFGASQQGSTFSNKEQAHKAATENVLCPLWSFLEDELTHQLGADLGLQQNERLAFDLTRVRVLREDRDALYKRVTAAYKVGGWMKRSEAREEAGLPVTPDDDVYYDEVKPQPMLGPGSPADPNADPLANEQKKSLKAVEFLGQVVARKPTDAEAAQVPAIAAAQDAARVALVDVLAAIRRRLIADALASWPAGPTPDRLTPDESAALTVAVTRAYNAGFLTTEQPIPQNKSLGAALARIVIAIGAALIARVTGRVVDEVSRAEMRGLTLEEALAIARTVLDEEPAAYVEELASGAAYEAVGAGRNDGLVGLIGPNVRFIYSAILDRNTCEKCKTDDLKEADDPRKLPHAPNPACLGRWRCRCQIVIARD